MNWPAELSDPERQGQYEIRIPGRPTVIGRGTVKCSRCLRSDILTLILIDALPVCHSCVPIAPRTVSAQLARRCLLPFGHFSGVMWAIGFMGSIVSVDPDGMHWPLWSASMTLNCAIFFVGRTFPPNRLVRFLTWKCW